MKLEWKKIWSAWRKWVIYSKNEIVVMQFQDVITKNGMRVRSTWNGISILYIALFPSFVVVRLLDSSSVSSSLLLLFIFVSSFHSSTGKQKSCLCTIMILLIFCTIAANRNSFVRGQGARSIVLCVQVIMPQTYELIILWYVLTRSIIKYLFSVIASIFFSYIRCLFFRSIMLNLIGLFVICVCIVFFRSFFLRFSPILRVWVCYEAILCV